MLAVAISVHAGRLKKILARESALFCAVCHFHSCACCCGLDSGAMGGSSTIELIRLGLGLKGAVGNCNGCASCGDYLGSGWRLRCKL